MSYFDDKETRSADERDQALFAALPKVLAHALTHAPALAAELGDIDPASVCDRAALAALPVVRKSELVDRQRAVPPFGGLTATPVGALGRLFQSPGPIYDPEGRGNDWWRMGRAFFAAGFRPGDIVQNCLSYHLSPGGFILDSGARACGCAVIPAGVGNTEQQLAAIAHLRPTGYAGTPSFLKVLLERAEQEDIDAGCLEKAVVTGEALPADLRAWFDDCGVAVAQCYATADLGLIAYESAAREGLILAEDIIVEIVRPGTGDPLPDGEVGEVVVTNLNPDYPLIRFATGDLSAILPGHSPCGRTNRRIRGWLGRADQTTKIKGMFVHPHQIAEVARRHPAIGRARLEVVRDNHQDVMTLKLEGPEALDLKAVAETLRMVTKLRGVVTRVAPDSLPNDGKVIDDRRPVD